MTLRQLYLQAKQAPKPEAPGTAFIRELADVTKKSEIAVRRWLSDSETSVVPDALTQSVLAEHFNTTPDALFPERK